jgi:hypothetical protein
MALGGVFFGFVIALVTTLVYNFASRHSERKMKRERSVDGTDPLLLQTASIAKDLVPLVEKLRIGKGEITIVGGDGSYLTNKRTSSYFVKAISNWLSQGVKVKYILVCPSDKARGEFYKLEQKLENFEVSAVNGDCEIDTSEFVEKFRNSHPTLLTAEDGRRAMWLEGIHPDGSEYAYNIKFVPPNAMDKGYTEKFCEIEKELNGMLRVCGPIQPTNVSNNDQIAA